MRGQHQQDRLQAVLQHSAENNPSGILDLITEIYLSRDPTDLSILRTLLWPMPTKIDLIHLAKFLVSNQVSHVYSIGCGSGLLEYLLLWALKTQGRENLPKDSDQNNYHSSGQRSSSWSPNEVTKITGIEIDSPWWKSPYAPPVFLPSPLKYINEDFFPEETTFGTSNDLILFSYFNNMKVFKKYLKHFNGKYLAIIGPTTQRYCAPCPLDIQRSSQNRKEDEDDLIIMDWNLISFRQFGHDVVDHLAMYAHVI